MLRNMRILELIHIKQETSPIKRIVTLWLLDKSSSMTRYEYEKDLCYFFESMSQKMVTEELIKEFLEIKPFQANAALIAYKGYLRNKKLAPATINRKISVVKSFVCTAYRLGLCQYSLKDVFSSEKSKSYRDTSGITLEEFKQVIALCELKTMKGKRDKALFMLLWSNALRRNEISLLNSDDIDYTNNKLWIRGKGYSEKHSIDLSDKCIQAVKDWLACRNNKSKAYLPLFIALDSNSMGNRLSGDGIYKIVRRYCQKAGINKRMSPHRIRHSSITIALDKSNGDVRKVQKLSRHKNLNTLMIYDDNRNQDQLKLSNLLEQEL